MAEVSAGVMGHSELIHDANGWAVFRNGKGHDFIESFLLKSSPHRFLGRFGGIPLPPITRVKMPTDFDTGPKGEFMMGNR